MKVSFCVIRNGCNLALKNLFINSIFKMEENMARFLLVLPLVVALCACDNKPSGGTTGTTGTGTTGTGTSGGGDTKPAASKKAPPDPFESWSGCKEGSMVEFEMETSGMKMKQSKTLDKKGADECVLKTEMVMKVGDNETKTPGEEKVQKPKGGTDGECPLCHKKFSEHKDEGKWTEESVKVGDKDVKAWKYEIAPKNCKGDDNPKTTMWYSADVPGGMVKMETAQMKMTLTKFEKK